MKFLDVIVSILLIIGGLNWGIIALMDMDVVAYFTGAGTTITKIIYGLVGLAAVYKIFQCNSIRERWSK